VKHFPIVLPFLAFALSVSCASNEFRKPASSDRAPSETSLKLAKKLNGGSVRFIAENKNGGSSFFRYLSVEFKNCKAEVGNKELAEGGALDQEDYVACESDFHAGPIKGRVLARIWGEKKVFSFRFSDQKPNQHDVEVEAKLIWDSNRKEWTGEGAVSGWLKSGSENNGIVITVREKIKI
jgi:hypothetical protein